MSLKDVRMARRYTGVDAYLDGFVLQAKSVQSAHCFVSVLLTLVVDKSIAQALTCIHKNVKSYKTFDQSHLTTYLLLISFLLSLLGSFVAKSVSQSVNQSVSFSGVLHPANQGDSTQNKQRNKEKEKQETVCTFNTWLSWYPDRQHYKKKKKKKKKKPSGERNVGSISR